MSGPMFSGSITALITPFRDGRLDEDAFQRFVEWQIEEGTSALVSCGTTGESPTLTHEEDMRVTALCIEAAKGRVPVIAGTGSNSTEEAILLTRHAKAAGADAALIVTPYYNKPRRKASTSTIGRSTTRWKFPSSSTTFLGAASSTCRLRPWRGWPNCPTSSG
jgi:4-hydroxy-tetrahydrodipicolinate synthase